jgi:hypothetical protein
MNSNVFTRRITISITVIFLTVSGGTVMYGQSRTNGNCEEGISSERETAITLTIGNTVIPAVLNNTVSARDLISRLPYTVKLTRYSHDYCGVMSNPLKFDQKDVRSGWCNGDIHFATDGPYVVLFFGDEENSKQFGHQIHIGHINADAKVLENLRNRTIDVLIQVAGRN